MKLTSSLRTPYRSRAIVRSEGKRVIEEARLVRATVLTQLVLTVLCGMRAGGDFLSPRPMTLEGAIAFVAFVALATTLVAKALGGPACKRGAGTHFLRSTRRAR